MKAVNRAYDRIETRPFWKLRLIAIVLVFATGLVTAGMFLLIVFGGSLGDAIVSRTGLGDSFKLFWNIARWPIAFVAVLLFFAFVYYLAPNVEQRDWRWVSPGSLVGALLWLVLSGLFALYTSYSSSYARTYGSIAGAIILLLWLNYSAWAILFGAELNAELDRQADIHAAGGPNAGLVRPAGAPLVDPEVRRSFLVASERTVYLPGLNDTVHVTVPLNLTPVFLFTPVPITWKLSAFVESRTASL